MHAIGKVCPLLRLLLVTSVLPVVMFRTPFVLIFFGHNHNPCFCFVFVSCLGSVLILILVLFFEFFFSCWVFVCSEVTSVTILLLDTHAASEITAMAIPTSPWQERYIERSIIQAHTSLLGRNQTDQTEASNYGHEKLQAFRRESGCAARVAWFEPPRLRRNIRHGSQQGANQIQTRLMLSSRTLAHMNRRLWIFCCTGLMEWSNAIFGLFRQARSYFLIYCCTSRQQPLCSNSLPHQCERRTSKL